MANGLVPFAIENWLFLQPAWARRARNDGVTPTKQKN